MTFTLQIQSVIRPVTDYTLERVSVSADGTQANQSSSGVSLSANGRYVVFESTATTLGPSAAGIKAIFRKDLITGEVSLVSSGGDGAAANNISESAAISADGRYVVFQSTATNLAPGATIGWAQIYRKDMMTGAIALVSTPDGFAPGNLSSFSAQISHDGRYVTFLSDATSLIGADGNGVSDAFRKDMVTGEMTLVSFADGPQAQANADIDMVRISADGRYVLFDTHADNLVVNDVNGSRDVFRKDLHTGEIELVSTASDGTQAVSGTSSGDIQMSADGRYVVFVSDSANLVPGGTNGRSHVFRKDLHTGETLLVSTGGAAASAQANGSSGSPSISADGRYVVFLSYADNLVSGDTNGTTDAFRKDLLTGEIVRLTAPSAAQGFEEANDDNAMGSISADGRFLVFESSASNLIPNGTSAFAVFQKNLETGAITVLSVDLNDVPRHATGSDVSETGRYVTFESTASNLVAGDTNNAGDIFRMDTTTGIVEIVSAIGLTAQSQGNKASSSAHVSADGNYVLFSSEATNLVAGDLAGSDVFRKDMISGAIIRISTNAAGTSSANGFNYDGAMSSNGRYVAFSGSSTDLVAGDLNGAQDVYFKDLTTNEMVLVSTAGDPSRTQGNQASYSPDVSDDGTFVVFASYATNLVGADTNGRADIFRKNVKTGEILRVSDADDATHTQANSDNRKPKISADGRYVLFESDASNLVAGDTRGATDLFHKDLDTGAIIRVSTASDGAEANARSTNGTLSADGRYVTFESDASNLIAHDTNGKADIFRKDVLTGETIRLSETDRPAQGREQAERGSGEVVVSSDGLRIVLRSTSSNLVTGDTNSQSDIFLADLSLLPYADAINEGRFLQISLDVGTASSASVSWGDGSVSTVNPSAGKAAFAHAWGTAGIKEATISVQDGALTWSVPYRIDVAAGTMSRNTSVADTVTGGAGNDSLVGDAGANILIGNGGNDSYEVNDLRDVVRETVGGGSDTVTTSVSFALASDAEIEIVMATGAAAIGLTGNAFANILSGTTGANRIAGGDGTDTLKGLSGNDTLLGDFGNDRLYGSSGRDTLAGGKGRDIFVFDTKANKKSNLDKITDFSVRDDTIWLENTLFKVGKGSASKPTKMSKKMFWSGTSAHDSDDRIIYNKKNGVLYYDSDGTGGRKAVEIAVLKKNLKMTYADFFVI